MSRSPPKTLRTLANLIIFQQSQHQGAVQAWLDPGCHDLLPENTAQTDLSSFRASGSYPPRKPLLTEYPTSDTK